MIRRFVNVVAESCKTGVCSLHRLDVSKHLFHQTRTEAQLVPPLLPAQANIVDTATGGGEEPEWTRELPAPCVKIRPFLSYGRMPMPGLAFFGLGNSDKKLLAINRPGDAILCDAETQIISDLPSLHDEMGIYPIGVSAVNREGEEELYLIHNGPFPFHGPSSRFSVLTNVGMGGYWRWDGLEPPPAAVHSHAVLDGGRTICVSSDSRTYCFDTVEREWCPARDWVLPFAGRAEYVPDLNLWLGFESFPHRHLCGTSDDLATEDPPKLQHVWQDLDSLPEDWVATSADLISLGSGRFCIVKTFEIACNDGYGDIEYLDPEIVVLTGVELVKGGGDGQQFELLRHRSIFYLPNDCRISWVL